MLYAGAPCPQVETSSPPGMKFETAPWRTPSVTVARKGSLDVAHCLGSLPEFILRPAFALVPAAPPVLVPVVIEHIPQMPP